MPLPVGDPIFRAGNTELGMVLIPETDLEHQVQIAMLHHLTSRYPVLFPGVLWLGSEDRVFLFSLRRTIELRPMTVFGDR